MMDYFKPVVANPIFKPHDVVEFANLGDGLDGKLAGVVLGYAGNNLPIILKSENVNGIPAEVYHDSILKIADKKNHHVEKLLAVINSIMNTAGNPQCYSKY